MKTRTRATQTRIVSLAPSATSILCALGARELLAGVTKWCADVAPVASLPKLGDAWHMGSIDEVLALRPTIVIGSVPYKMDTVGKLIEQPVNFLAMNPRTLADIESDIHLLGSIAGHAAQARRLIRTMREDFAAIAKKAPRADRRIRVYCEAWPNPRISSPPWVNEIVQLCGGEMTVPCGQKVSDAQIAEAAPEVIVLAWAATGNKANPKKAYQVSAWKNIPAIRNKHVYVVRDELLNTPGPPLVAGAKELLRLFQKVRASGSAR